MVEVPVLVAVFSILEKAKDYMKTTTDSETGRKKTRERKQFEAEDFVSCLWNFNMNEVSTSAI